MKLSLCCDDADVCIYILMTGYDAACQSISYYDMTRCAFYYLLHYLLFFEEAMFVDLIVMECPKRMAFVFYSM